MNARDQYNMLMEIGELRRMFPSFSGIWEEDREEFSQYWELNQEILSQEKSTTH